MTVTVPLSAVGGPPPEATTLTATAVTGGASDSEVDYTQVAQTFGVDIEPPRSELVSPPLPQTVSFTHFITNTGNGVDTVNITTTPLAGATISVLPSAQCANLAPGAWVWIALALRRSTSGEVVWLSTRQDGFDSRTPCCRGSLSEPWW